MAVLTGSAWSHTTRRSSRKLQNFGAKAEADVCSDANAGTRPICPVTASHRGLLWVVGGHSPEAPVASRSS